MSVDLSSVTLQDHIYKFTLNNKVTMQGYYRKKDDKFVTVYNDVYKEEQTVPISQIVSFVDDGTRGPGSDLSNPTIPSGVGPKGKPRS